MNVFDIVFWAALALSVISLIVAVILFFKDKIWLVVGYFTGVKSGKRMAGRVHMHSTSSKPDAPAKPKPEKLAAVFRNLLYPVKSRTYT